MRRSHGQAFLTYPITRHYPNPWVDWVVAILLILCTVLFTFVNLATTGYNVEIIHTLNPNGTVAHKHWFETAPWSWFNSVSATCQGSPIAKGSSVFTTNLGLIYTVDKIWQEQSSFIQPFPAISYLNTSLVNCTVDQIDVQMHRREHSDRNDIPGNFWTWDSSWAEAGAVCNIIADSGVYFVSVNVTLPPIREADNNALLRTFVQLNKSQQPVIYLGAQLLNVWYERIAKVLSSQESFTNDTRLDSAQMLLLPNQAVSDITSLDFFHAAGVVYPNANGAFIRGPDAATIGDLQAFANNSCDSINSCGLFKLAQISRNIDVFGKCFLATVLADLGQTQAFRIDPNVGGIEFLVSTLGEVPEDLGGSANSTFLGFPSATAWDSLKSSIPLDVRNATIYAEYSCSVPKLKDTMSLLVSLFIANFVLLQAAWTIIRWSITRFLERNDTRMDYCEGCINSAKDDVPLLTKQPYARIHGDVIS